MHQVPSDLGAFVRAVLFSCFPLIQFRKLLDTISIEIADTIFIERSIFFYIILLGFLKIYYYS